MSDLRVVVSLLVVWAVWLALSVLDLVIGARWVRVDRRDGRVRP